MKGSACTRPTTLHDHLQSHVCQPYKTVCCVCACCIAVLQKFNRMVSVPFNITKFGHLPHIMKPLQFIQALAIMMFTLSASAIGAKIFVMFVGILSLLSIVLASVIVFLSLDDKLFSTCVRLSWNGAEMGYSGVASLLYIICMVISFSASGSGRNYSFYFVTYLCFVQFVYFGVEFTYFMVKWRKGRSDSAQLSA